MKRISIVPNALKDPGFAVTGELIELFRQGGSHILLDEELSTFFNKADSIEFVQYKELFRAELLFTLGGDGTILQLASLAAESGIPIIGINLGRIGFLAELEWKQRSVLPKLLEGGFDISERMMLGLYINGEYCGAALNDICITADHPVKLVDFDLSVNGRAVSHYRADGVIFSTPTGTTAYTLSAGGPVIDPRLECIAVTPICSLDPSHSCPLIFSSESEIKISGIRERGLGAAVTMDGKIFENISPKDKITIKKSNSYLKLARLKDQEFYDILFIRSQEGRA